MGMDDLCRLIRIGFQQAASPFTNIIPGGEKRRRFCIFFSGAQVEIGRAGAMWRHQERPHARGYLHVEQGKDVARLGARVHHVPRAHVSVRFTGKGKLVASASRIMIDGYSGHQETSLWRTRSRSEYNRTRLRPLFFAAYMAESAHSMRSRLNFASWPKIATPILMLKCSTACGDPAKNFACSTARRRRSATNKAPGPFVSGRMITNSSPP